MVYDEGKILFEMSMHENEIFTNRINLFFLAESMLFVSFATSMTNITSVDFKIHISSLLIALGISTTILFMFVLWRHSKDLYILKKKVDDKIPIIKEIRKQRDWGSANIILSQLFPEAFLFIWLLLGFLNTMMLLWGIISAILTISALILYQIAFYKNLRTKDAISKIVKW